MLTTLGPVQSEGFMLTLLAIQCRLSFDKHQQNKKKKKFIAYIYIYSNQNLDYNSYTCYISTKIEALKHLHIIFLLTA